MYKLLLTTLLVGIAASPAFGSEMVAEELIVKKEVRAVASCFLCEAIMTDAQNKLKNNASESQILQFIEDKLCIVTGPLYPVCKIAIESFGPQILKMLAAHVHPAKICKDLAFINQCTSADCVLCKSVMTDAQTMLNNNASEAKILDFMMDKLCANSGYLNPPCAGTISSTYGPQILKMLAAQVDPAKICEFIGLCIERTFVKEWIVEMPKVESRNAIVCTVCQYAVEFLDTQLKNNKTEAAIEHALENVCKIAPSALRPECTSLINQYGIYLVELLIELADPLKVCQTAKLC